MNEINKKYKQNKKENKNLEKKILNLNIENNIKKEKDDEDEKEPLLIEQNNKLIINNQNEEGLKIYTKNKPKKICFYKRRTKYPNNFKSLKGFLLTFFYFIFFSTLITICLQSIKTLYSISDKLKKIYNIILIILWVSGIISIIILIDVFTSDPGQQRGFQISKDKYINSKIKKIIKGQKYILKFCETCNMIRDIRTFHCNICGICVEKHDHHCERVSNCIGVYNYKKFFIFVNSSIIYLFIIFGICMHYFNRYNQIAPGGAWVFLIMFSITIIDFISLFETLVLLYSHIRSVLYNITIREGIKKKRYKAYDRGFKENCKEALFRNQMNEL